MTAIEAELKTALRTGKVVLGSRKTIKLLKLGKAKAAIVSAKAPPIIRRDVLYYAKLSGIPVYVYPGTTRELGMLCAKPFVVSALAVVDEGDSKIVDAIKAESRVE